MRDEYYAWLMRGEGMRLWAVDKRERIYGKRLGTVDIWQEILYELIERMEDALDRAAPEGYYFGMPYEEAGFKGFFPNHLLYADDGGLDAYHKFLAQRRSE
jgi:hypothetical protein